MQLSSDEYRRPDQLPAGAVPVVGAGQSGVQIADELVGAGRPVYLSIGDCGWVPRRFRGRDIAWWLVHSGFLDRTADSLPSPEARLGCFPQVGGVGGELDLRAAGIGSVVWACGAGGRWRRPWTSAHTRGCSTWVAGRPPSTSSCAGLFPACGPPSSTCHTWPATGSGFRTVRLLPLDVPGANGILIASKV